MSTMSPEIDSAFTVEGRPCFKAKQVEDFVQEHYGLHGVATPLPAEWDQNFKLESVDGTRHVVKIANAGTDPELLEFQNDAMQRLGANWKPGVTPCVIKSISGQTIGEIRSSSGQAHALRVLTWLDGEPMSSVNDRSPELLEEIGSALGEMDVVLETFEHPAMGRTLRWDLAQGQWISGYTKHILDLRKRGIVERMLLQFRGRVAPRFADLPTSVVHNDANDENILLVRAEDGTYRLAGLLDFGDMVRTNTINELAIAGAYAILDHDDPMAILGALTRGYHAARPLNDVEFKALFPLLCLRLCISVTNSAMTMVDDPDNTHRLSTDGPAWDMLDRLESIDWREAENVIREACGLEPQPFAMSETSDRLRVARTQRIGPSLSLAYDAPLEIIRGRGQFLYEPNERANLDCVNNVCHVGHCHPRVVEALATQAATLNTNTRYLHPILIEFARRLTDTLPESLSVCYFVNSGSEANELAVRLAKAFTGRRDAIVLENAYHGNTQTLIDLSPYKCEGQGGQGLPDWVHKVTMPDPYRGKYRGRDEEAGRKYAMEVGELCARLTREGMLPAFFIAEPVVGCGGQVVPPDGYLRYAFEHVRASGWVCIADEVQVGMGRAGKHWWAFQAQAACPDIVTMGKPIGNGHPLGAVVTTPDIAKAFDNGMEYFSTFGGNPVSMAVGLAVLDVIEEEGLRERATRISEYLKAGFYDLAK
ncbi:MAG: aminotransferase class III-fold pyridoxal phosphate-dependent enzyme, partial [Planctomycetota bacterium]|nr:aminotransferase class III-fold pyridoxal phosphate-dependent enzyme [Planctomycetota bacterium]